MSTIEKLIDLEDNRKKQNQGVEQSAADKSGLSEAASESRQKRTIKLDYELLAATGIFPPDENAPNVRDELRRIKRPLLSNALGKQASLVEHGNLVMVTSALPGEGKTFTAVNLALSITLERDYTVLLMDADFTKSDTTKLFGLENKPGLSDVLLNESLSVGDVLVKTDVPNLSLLPSGPLHPHATELLASKRMERIMSEMEERYPNRIIIFDSPPILATSEAELLMRHAGQIALVIEAGSTLQHVVEQAVARLDKSKAVGIILNQTQRTFGVDRSAGYGYYGYGDDE